MGKRLEKEFGEHIAEKRGWHWVLTSFAMDVWGATEKTTSNACHPHLTSESLRLRLEAKYAA